MFNIGFTEMIFLAVIALLFIGPKQPPEMARTIGRFLNELKSSSEAITNEFKTSDIAKEIKKPLEDIKESAKKIIETKNEHIKQQLVETTHDQFDEEGNFIDPNDKKDS